MSKHDDSDIALREAFQSLKAEHPLPTAVKQRVMTAAKKPASQFNWRSWWHFSQLALGCAALVLVLSWVNPAKLPAYYQIDTLSSLDNSSTAEPTVQWHHLTASAADNAEKSIVQQRLVTLKQQQRQFQQAGARSGVLHRQIGLLTQHEALWQIAMCDNMQLNVAIDLVHELNTQMQIKPVLQPQWVELQFTPTGHILAIAALPATTATSQCVSPSEPVVRG